MCDNCELNQFCKSVPYEINCDEKRILFKTGKALGINKYFNTIINNYDFSDSMKEELRDIADALGGK